MAIRAISLTNVICVHWSVSLLFLVSRQFSYLILFLFIAALLNITLLGELDLSSAFRLLLRGWRLRHGDSWSGLQDWDGFPEGR